MEENNKTDLFIESLTLAEIALLEENIGMSFEQAAQTNSTLFIPVLTQLALKRLKIETSLDTVKNFTFDESAEILDKASSKVPTRPKEINDILQAVRGK